MRKDTTLRFVPNTKHLWIRFDDNAIRYILCENNRDICVAPHAVSTGSHLYGDPAPKTKTILTPIGMVKFDFYHDGTPISATKIDGD